MPARSLFGRSACLLAVVFSSSVLAGCGGGGQSDLVGPDPTALSASAKAADGLMATLTQDKATTTTGTPLNYTFTLSNPTAQAVTVLAFGPVNAQGVSDVSASVPYTSLRITDAAGKTVYPDPKTVQPQNVIVPISVALPAGQAISQKITISGGLSSSGRYGASASFLISGFATATEVRTLVGPLTVSVR